jgi:hypothetical protein
MRTYSISVRAGHPHSELSRILKNLANTHFLSAAHPPAFSISADALGRFLRKI